MALIDVVRFDGLRSRDWLVYKFPSDSLVLGTRLIVQEGQAALFVKNGRVFDTFFPGDYTLETDNLPLLKEFVKLPYGGRTPFSAEVYFVNTALRMDLQWGTTDPIQLIDPKFRIKLRIRAFGQMGVRVEDPANLFTNLIGAMPQADIIKMDKIREYYRGLLVIKVKSAIAAAMIQNNISALDISTQLEPLSEAIQGQITDSFARYGLKVTSFFIQSINFPDEDFAAINKILEDRAAFDIMGDGRYVTKRSFDVYEGAANNESGVAGAFAAGGIGFGAAMGMGGAMGQVVGQPLRQAVVRTCPSCGAQLAEGANFCPSCGADCRQVTCQCGAVLAPGMKFCPQCGRKV